MKIFVCNTWIMKKLKCLFAKHELWTSLFALHELWKYFVCNTWIMKI